MAAVSLKTQVLGDELVGPTPPLAYARPAPDASVQRIAASASGLGTRVFETLACGLEPPLILLYVLHTPRVEDAAGRYQSPPLELAEVESFLRRRADYLACDARFDLWAHSPSQAATVVWDRHDVVFGYGPLDDYEVRLHALGFAPVSSLEIDVPHVHHYRSEFDADAQAVLADFDWHRTDLREEDEQ